MIKGETIKPEPIPTTKAVKEVPKLIAKPKVQGCEQYRALVSKYFGDQTENALLVASKESRCIADRVSGLNKNGTRDYCLFQINNEASMAKDVEKCVKRAYQKFTDGRIGKNNWSAWYAVCTPKAVPKYEGIKCQ